MATGNWLRWTITQTQIAEQAGLSRQPVSALLAQLEQAGKVRRGYRALLWWGRFDATRLRSAP
ncbi:helix-turn-helix domain-containing protein [Ideonella sp.]|uniref:helix-turn-helix domain-containing protein n=1 Tax=Ideonella sp. TaxID=1929293 RepID=UPI0037C06397